MSRRQVRWELSRASMASEGSELSKRHAIRRGDLESVFARLQELVLANSGEDEFEEIFKLLIAKLLSERGARCGAVFASGWSAQATAERVNGLLREASERWKGILPSPPTSRLTDEHLAVCVEALAGHDLHEAGLEVLDAAFEYLVNRAAKGAKGQYFTPRFVVECCIRAIDPRPNETVLDPACGSGGFLVHALNHVRRSCTGLDAAEYATRRLWGFDIDARAIRVAKALMLIAGDGHANLFRVNSLMPPLAQRSLFDEIPREPDMPSLVIEDVIRARMRNFHGFDIIATNPPFAGEVREQGMLGAFSLHRPGRRIERDVLFLERCVQLLKPGGRLAIVLPYNKLGSRGWSYVREWLLRHVQIVAGLGLGRCTFQPHTGQKAGVLFGIKRERPVLRPDGEEILFCISEHDGKDSAGQVLPRLGTTADDPPWRRADHDLDEFVERFEEFRARQGFKWGG